MSIVDELYSEIDNGREGRNLGLKTGLPKLDWYTGGFQKGVYKLIFGQSGSGKSSYVIYSDLYRILRDYPDRDIVHVYFSLEMSSKVLLAKLLNLYIYDTYGIEISYMTLMSVREKLSDKYYKYIQESRVWLNSIIHKLIIFDKQLSSNTFYGNMKELLKQWGTFQDIDEGRRNIYIPSNPDKIINVIIDHAGLLTPVDGRTKKQEIDQTSQYCVYFREKCGISIDFIMQENRNTSDVNRLKMDLAEPTLDDVKDSGNAGNDCNICVAVYNPIKYQRSTYRGYTIINKEYPEESLGSAMRGLILLKHRFGVANKVFCTGFQGSLGRFEELPDPGSINYEVYQSWKDEKLEDEITKDTAAKDAEEKDSLQKPIFKF